jgi:predicted dehydrogenase
MPVVAVVGTGFIGPVHVEALHRLGITVRGILGSSADRSRQAAGQLNLEIAYPDYQAILDDPLVDAIHITTPNKTHFDLSQRALLADKHVICEKPLAMNARETAELVELARSKPNLISAVNYNIRFYPIALHARELVQRGAIGDVFHVRGAYLQDWLLQDTDWNWRLVPEEGGDTRAIGDIGTHWMDLTSFITGLRIEAVMADLQTFITRRKKPRQAVATFKGKEQSGQVEYDLVDIHTEDWGAVLFHYAGGARGSMSVSQVNAGRKNQLTFEIAGSKGAIAWDSERPNELWLGHRERANESLLKDPSLLGDTARMYANYPGGHNEGFPDTFKQLYRAIYGYIQVGDFSKPKPFPTFEDGHHEVVLCDAILASHREHRWVDI